MYSQGIRPVEEIANRTEGKRSVRTAKIDRPPDIEQQKRREYPVEHSDRPSCHNLSRHMVNLHKKEEGSA